MPIAEINFSSDEYELLFGTDEFIKAEASGLLPEQAYCYRWTLMDRTTTTHIPEFHLHCENEGKHPLQVELLDQTGKAIASDTTTLSMVKSDTEWVIEERVKYDEDNGKEIGEYIAKKYMVRKGTRIKHGLYYESFHDSMLPNTFAGKQWHYCHVYEEDRLARFCQYAPSGEVVHVYQLDENDKKDGYERQGVYARSEECVDITRWSHGIKQRYERWIEGKQLIELTLYSATGVPVLTQGYATHPSNAGRLIRRQGYNAEGKLHGPYKSWHNDGKVKESGQYQDGFRAGHWEIWNWTGEKTYDKYFSDKEQTLREIHYSGGKPDKEVIYKDGTRTEREL